MEGAVATNNIMPTWLSHIGKVTSAREVLLDSRVKAKISEYLTSARRLPRESGVLQAESRSGDHKGSQKCDNYPISVYAKTSC